MIEVDGRQMDWTEGLTLETLLAEREEAKWCAVVRLNGRLVSSPNFADTLVPDGAKIQLLPLVAGG